MKLEYKGRDTSGNKVSGVINSVSRKAAIKELKEQGIIPTEIKDFKEKKDFKKIFHEIKKQINTKMNKNNEKSSEKEKKSFNFSEKFSFLNKFMKKTKSDENSEENDKNKERYALFEINSALNREDLFDLSKDIDIGIKKEIDELDVDAILNSDFKSSFANFKKTKKVRKKLLKTDFDIKSLKKLLTSDIGGKKDKNAVKMKKSKKVKHKELLLFCKKVSTLLDTGVPITKCLQLLMHQTENAYFQKVLAYITKDVAQGISVSSAMSNFPKVFSPHFTALVKTGEDTGELSKTFELLYDEILNSEKIKAKVKGAAMYPCVILGVLLIAFIIAAKILVPMFSDLFAGMGLPKFTEIVFAFLSFFDKNLHWIALAIFIMSFICKFLLQNIILKYKFDTFKITLPVIGEVLTKYHTINILRTIDISLKNGLSITDALKLAVQTTDNFAFKIELQKISNKIIQGISLSFAMDESPIFPKLCVHMLKIGEESGKMTQLITKTLDFYEWELNDFIDQSSKLIEPVAIIFVGVFVVCFVFAVAIPMFDLSSGAML